MDEKRIFHNGSKGAEIMSEKRWSLLAWLRSLWWQRSLDRSNLTTRPKRRPARSSKKKHGDIYPLF